MISTIEVGYNPDSASFSKDGSYLVVANEDDREDRSCKPADRNGGSVSILDLRSGNAAASVIQEIAVDHDTDSEPEGVKVSPDNNTVIVAIQETSEVGFFNLADVPNATMTRVALPEVDGNAAEPDGLAISPDGTVGVIANERNGTFSIVSMADKTLYGTYSIENDSSIVSYSGGASYFSSPPYNVDARKATKRTEPEETNIITKTDKNYVLMALQESHGVIVFDITDPTAPIFDSIAPSGINYAEDIGMEKSDIGSEGLATHPTTGVVLVANEREGSITLMKSNWTDDYL